MIRMRALLPALLLISSAAFGQVPITQLPPATVPLATTEQVPIVQNGVTVKAKDIDIAASGVTTVASHAAPYTLLASDMGSYIILTGAGNFTINTTIMVAGKIVCYINGNALGSGSNITINGTQTVSLLPSATVRPLGGGCLVADQAAGVQWSPGLPGGDPAMLGLADQTLSGGANLTVFPLATGNITVDCGKNPGQWIANTGAFSITAPANDGECMVQVENGASAAVPTFSGFSVGTNTGDTLDTTNGHIFQIWVSRLHGHATYRVAALQ